MGTAFAIVAPGSAPGVPSNVTSIAKDAGAVVSFLAPASHGSSPVLAYTVTPYAAGVPKAPTTVAVGSLGSIVGSDGNTYLQATVSGLTNNTAHTFSVLAANSSGPGLESAQSGANTPLSGLVFGDDFNGSHIDPEWWLTTIAGASDEADYYLPSQAVLDGAGNLVMTATYSPFTGANWPSIGGNVTKNYRTALLQSNTRTFVPVAGNTMSFEAKLQIPSPITDGYGPAFWLKGQGALGASKTDGADFGSWANAGLYENDVVEFGVSGTISNASYLQSLNAGSGWQTHANATGVDMSLAMHTYRTQWKPGVSTAWYLDGALVVSDALHPPTTATQWYMLLQHAVQGTAGTGLPDKKLTVDYVRVFDQNLG